jgi:hypothetical protein
LRAIIAAAIAVGCRRDPVTSCADDLGGMWESGSQAWHLLDDGRAVEIDPLFADAPPGAAPRVADLVREGDGLAGTLHRMYVDRDTVCDARVPIRIAACRAGELEVVVSDPAPPIAFAPCTWPRPAASRVERWHRH